MNLMKLDFLPSFGDFCLIFLFKIPLMEDKDVVLEAVVVIPVEQSELLPARCANLFHIEHPLVYSGLNRQLQVSYMFF